MEHITAAIIADLQQGRDIDRPIPICRTDRACVAKLTDDLLQILFPGGFPDEDTLRYHLASTNRELSGLLASLLSDTCRAQQTCREFFRAIVPIRELVQTDVQAAFDGDPLAGALIGGGIGALGGYALNSHHSHRPPRHHGHGGHRAPRPHRGWR